MTVNLLGYPGNKAILILTVKTLAGITQLPEIYFNFSIAAKGASCCLFSNKEIIRLEPTEFRVNRINRQDKVENSKSTHFLNGAIFFPVF